LGLDLDHVIPFAAVSENGCEIDGLDDSPWHVAAFGG
jgi:3-oxoacyl-ACP reductase-like protein